MPPSIADLRREYAGTPLLEEAVHPDAIAQFRAWFEEALSAEVVDPNAMTLATATPDGRPSARIVLLKGLDARGFVFFTDYGSRKGRELEANPHAALVFYWPELHRQVRVTGVVTRVPAEESEAYFRSRPQASRLSAWTSRQSEPVASREELEARRREAEAAFPDGDVPRPDRWGGFVLAPEAIEFWQGRTGRLHDRLRYTRRPDGGWRIERLSP
ncbi:MAG TPA: pyridoxamine 5'-phosphate oxidase [Longimicrobiales bacterium]